MWTSIRVMHLWIFLHALFDGLGTHVARDRGMHNTTSSTKPCVHGYVIESYLLPVYHYSCYHSEMNVMANPIKTLRQSKETSPNSLSVGIFALVSIASTYRTVTDRLPLSASMFTYHNAHSHCLSELSRKLSRVRSNIRAQII